MPDNSLFAQVLGPVNRADPYPLYARMRETPVVRADDGTYIVSTDPPKSKHARTGNPLRDFIVNPVKESGAAISIYSG